MKIKITTHDQGSPTESFHIFSTNCEQVTLERHYYASINDMYTITGPLPYIEAYGTIPENKTTGETIYIAFQDESNKGHELFILRGRVQVMDGDRIVHELSNW